jgi:[ribosomal protein S5]-alanine N-acetyltransferase
MKIEIRNQRISDARRFFEILNNPNFKYFSVCPKDIEAEKVALKQIQEKRKKKTDYNYTIICDGVIVGGCGIKINQRKKFIGEIGYFLDEKYWGRGITAKAVKLLEKKAFSEMKLSRIEILMNPENINSEKVAIKCGYKKEGLMKGAISSRGKIYDAYMYAKVK